MTQPSADRAKQAMAKSIPQQQGVVVTKKSSDVQSMLERYLPQIQKSLPRDIDPKRWIQILVTVVAKNHDLLKCTDSSLIGAALSASALGFNPNPVLGHCYFIPYKNNKKGGIYEVQFQIGYKGYMNLARKSGDIRDIFAQVVREGDEFTLQYGLEPKLTHIPNMDNMDAKIIFAYAVVHFLNGGFSFVVITRSQIEKLRKMSPSQYGKATPDGVWFEWYDKMAMAKAIKQLVPYLPLKDEDAEKVAYDDAVVEKMDDYTDVSITYPIDDPTPVIQVEPLPEKKEVKPAEDNHTDYTHTGPAPEVRMVGEEVKPPTQTDREMSEEEFARMIADDEKKGKGKDSSLFPPTGK